MPLHNPLDPIEYIRKQLTFGRSFDGPLPSYWGMALVGSGAHQNGIEQLFLQTGVTANSSATAAQLFPALAGPNTASHHFWEMDKRHLIGFSLSRAAGNDAECVARFQMKQTNAIGALGAMGLGVRVDNLALVGESYGTALGTVALGNLVLARRNWVCIDLLPGQRVDFYLDGVLAGSQTTANAVPNGDFANLGYLVASVANGATGGVDCHFSIAGLSFWRDV